MITSPVNSNTAYSERTPGPMGTVSPAAGMYYLKWHKAAPAAPQGPRYAPTDKSSTTPLESGVGANSRLGTTESPREEAGATPPNLGWGDEKSDMSFQDKLAILEGQTRGTPSQKNPPSSKRSLNPRPLNIETSSGNGVGPASVLSGQVTQTDDQGSPSANGSHRQKENQTTEIGVNSPPLVSVPHNGESIQNGVAEISAKLNRLSQEVTKLSQEVNQLSQNGVDPRTTNEADLSSLATEQYGQESAQNGVAGISTKLDQLSQKLGQLPVDELERSLGGLRNQMSANVHNPLNRAGNSNENHDNYKSIAEGLINLQQQINAVRGTLSQFNLPVTENSSSGVSVISQTDPSVPELIETTDTLQTTEPSANLAVGITGVDGSTSSVDNEGKWAEVIDLTADRITAKLLLSPEQKLQLKEIIVTHLELEVARQRRPVRNEEVSNLGQKYSDQLKAFEDMLQETQKQELTKITESREENSDEAEGASDYSTHIQALFLLDEDYKKIRAHYRIDDINFNILRDRLGLNDMGTITRL